jgi:carboxyl-terminal processing protease
MPRMSSALLMCLLLQACATFDPHGVMSRHMGNHAPGSGELNVQQRADAFDFVWKTIRQSYLDPSFNGVDWNAVAKHYRPKALVAADDKDFWLVLDKMTGELHDSHTRVESPQQYQEIKAKAGVSLSVLLQERDGLIVVERVGMTSEAWLAGLRPGTKMLKIDGVSAPGWWHRAMANAREGSTPWNRIIFANREFNTGKAGESVAVEFERADGSQVSTRIARNTIASQPHVITLQLASGFGYVRVPTFDESIRKEALEALDKLQTNRGVILDLRDNPGGSVRFAQEFASQFVNKRVDVARVVTRNHKPATALFGMVDLVKPEFTLEPVKKPLLQPLVILINPASASAAELAAAALQSAGRAHLMGDTSCGCLQGFLGYANIPGGGGLAYSEFGFAFKDGRKVEGVGIKPDDVVQPSLQDLASGRDPQFEAAVAWLNKH